MMYMKVLWINPSFLDYRIPLYEEIYKRSNNNFHLIYSKNRIPERCDTKIKKVLKSNAHAIIDEKRINIGHTKSDMANTSLSIPFPKGLYKYISEIKPEVIISEGFFQFTPWAVLYSFIHKIPLIIAYERTAHTERNCPFYRRLYRKIINLFVSGYVVNGVLSKEYLISLGAKPDRIYTGAMCADSFHLAQSVRNFSASEKASLKQTLNVDQRGYLYIYVGRIIELKGVIYLLKAWEKHILKHNYDKLLIIGDGILQHDYKHQFSSCNSIVFTGSIDYADIYKYYAIADVFVIPTLEDNWSLVVPEAMACGLPIACSIYNGCYPELVHDGINGTLFDPLKEETILTALDYFHSVDLKTFGAASARIEADFNPKKTADNIVNAVYEITK